MFAVLLLLYTLLLGFVMGLALLLVCLLVISFWDFGFICWLLLCELYLLILVIAEVFVILFACCLLCLGFVLCGNVGCVL